MQIHQYGLSCFISRFKAVQMILQGLTGVLAGMCRAHENMCLTKRHSFMTPESVYFFFIKKKTQQTRLKSP